MAGKQGVLRAMAWRCLGVLLFLHLVTGTTDFRHISYDDLAKKEKFQQEGVTSYAQLLFDVARQQVFVGARDNLYRLTLTTLTPIEHATWPAAKEKITACQDKGQSVDDCHNYIKVLLSNGKSLFTCGTNAFSPRCTWREIENINNVTSYMSGVAMCPYSPHSNVTTLLARGQSAGLFAGTPTDFSGADTAIYRTLALPNLRTRQYDSKWLNDPQFVGSFDTEDYVYFLFREPAVEYINCGKRIYSRIGRVCKYDPGSTMMMKDTWTTFSKARLNCSLPGEFPFYYDEIQGAAYQPEEGLVYATFTTPSNAIAGSAICAFNMSAIAAAFEGPFKHQENSGAAWERKPASHNEQKCRPASSPGSGQLTENQHYQLMDEAVHAATPGPLHTSTLERFTHIAVDVTPTKMHKSVAVLYVATTEGLIKKISVLPRTMETCIIEIWGPLPSTPITLQYLKETKSLYVGMQSALLRIPTVQCHRHRDSKSCLNAQEPYCGWDELLMKCTPASSQTPGGYLVTHWQQDATKCPVLTDPVNGGWSAWSAWHTCQHEVTAQQTAGYSSTSRSTDEESSDSCQCQTRVCNNPPAQNGGAGCTGSQVRVANCTVHGGWTSWSAWSACGQSCGPAMKTRRRTCTNPAPRHGGRLCIGSEHEENFCIDLPPCPSPVQPADTAPQRGVWSAWGPFSSCSRTYRGGFKIRKRSCESQSRKDGPVECVGCDFQIEECSPPAVQETKKYLSSPWVVSGNGSSGSGRTEKRFRFVCRAQTEDSSSVRVQVKEEERHCRGESGCGRRPGMAGPGPVSLESGLESEWSAWSACSHPCGGGSQRRVRTCDHERASCEGPLAESRVCNSKPCRGLLFQHGEPEAPGQWSCWGEWTECSVTCGFGVRSRARECLGPGPCEGPVRLNEYCERPSCEWYRGWDSWSLWSRCDESNLQHRRRKCLLEPNETECLGPSKQKRWCIADILDNDVNALPSRIEVAGVSVGAVVGSCVAGFLIGLALTAVMCFYYLRRRKPRIPGSPHYISKQNPYVTVPLKEVNTKRQPSFSGSINGNGTLRSSKNNSIINSLGSPKLYPKALEYESATLKRNSREQHIRAELDQDKYY